MTFRRAIAALILSLPAPLSAEVPVLALPVDCTLGQSCFIQQFVDRDPGPAARDFTCGSLSYDGHKGTDFAVPNVADALAGVDVIAAAPGRVIAIRDGEADHFTDEAATGTPGRDCGNGIVIDHGDGWETQYCHMQNGSVAVQPGQSVAAGSRLGRIGMSGRAAFPHLHLTLRHAGAVVDPFATGDIETCGGPANGMWRDAIPYTPGGLIDAGFSGALPSFAAIKLGQADTAILPADATALVFWAHLFGTRTGDILNLRIEGPDGVFSDTNVSLDRSQARAFRASGRKFTTRSAAPGRYTGTAILIRNGTEVDRIEAETELK